MRLGGRSLSGLSGLSVNTATSGRTLYRNRQPKPTPLFTYRYVPVDFVHAGGEAAGLAAEHHPAQPRQVDLTAVRVPGEHQVAPPAGQVLDRPRVVGQHDPRPVRIATRKRPVQVARPAPQVVHADQVQRPRRPRSSVTVSFRSTRTPSAARASATARCRCRCRRSPEGVADGIVVVSQNGKDAVAGRSAGGRGPPPAGCAETRGE